jgi:hypothetical protein
MTSRQRFQSILISGALKPEPGLPDNERHKTANGPSNFPFARTLGGVSLFDFASFDADSYEAAYPISDWRFFVPTRGAWTETVWIEIAPQVWPSVIRGTELLARWKAEQASGHTIMPLIEAAYIGDLSTSLFGQVLSVKKLPNGVYDVVPDVTISRSARAPA